MQSQPKIDRIPMNSLLRALVSVDSPPIFECLHVVTEFREGSKIGTIHATSKRGISISNHCPTCMHRLLSTM